MLRALAGNAERAAGAVQDGPPNALEYAVRAFAQTSRRLRSTRTFELALAVARDMDEYRQGVDAPHRGMTDAPHRNAPKPDASALRLPAETVRYLERAVEIAQSIPSKALEHEAGELLDKARNLRTDLPEALERARKLEGTSPQLELDFAEYDPPELRTPPPTAKPPTAPDLNVLDSLEAESPDVYADALVGSEAIAPQIASRFGAITAPVAARVDDDALHTHVPIEPGKPPQYVDLSVAGVLTLGGIALTTVFAGRNPILGGGFAILTMLGSGYLISSALLPHVRRFERAALSFGFAVGVSPFVLPVLNNAATDRRFLLLGLALAAGVSLAILVAYRKRQQPVRLGPRPDETVWSGLASQILEDFDEEGP